MLKRGSSVDQVGMPCSSNVATPDATTGMNPIALPDQPLPVNANDGGSRAAKAGSGVKLGDATKVNFKANDGCANP